MMGLSFNFRVVVAAAQVSVVGNHTIYKNHFVSRVSAVCGCMRVCNASLEPPQHPYERMIVRFRFARAARPQRAKTLFLLHKTAPNGRFET